MNPVLLYTDTKRITDEQTTLANVVTLYQSVYNAIKAVGITPTITEIDGLVRSARAQTPQDFINPYVANKIADSATSFVVNGVTLTRAAFQSMIALPNTSGILAALQPVWGANSQRVFIGDAKAARTDLLSLANEVIGAVAGANTTIANLFTYYTASDASAGMAAQLQAIADALNTFNGANSSFMAKNIPTIAMNQQGSYECGIPGLTISNGNFAVSMSFIRKYEETGIMEFARWW
ncbi:MAG: hypothetical protein JST19_13730 [Bacteroidetes bacterium]|nr:hypothetical protein [Bacteroidota bacterium]